MNAAAYRPLVVTYRNGSPVRLEDLGEVIDGVQNDKVITWLNNTPSIMFQVMKQPGTNTVEVVDKVRALFPQFREQLPPAINMDTLYDRSRVDSPVGGRRQVFARAGGGAGGDRDFPVPAQLLGHADSRAWRCRFR